MGLGVRVRESGNEKPQSKCLRPPTGVLGYALALPVFLAGAFATLLATLAFFTAFILHTSFPRSVIYESRVYVEEVTVVSRGAMLCSQTLFAKTRGSHEVLTETRVPRMSHIAVRHREARAEGQDRVHCRLGMGVEVWCSELVRGEGAVAPQSPRWLRACSYHLKPGVVCAPHS